MSPNSPYQSQPGEPVSLPPVPAMGQPLPAVPPASQPVQPQTIDAVARVAAEARGLTVQYANDPYKLSEALSQLKNTYLADQYHITTNQAEN